MEVHMRWWFCWITLAVLWRKAFAYVLPDGHQVDPWAWLKYPTEAKPAQMPPYMPPYKPIKPHVHMPPYMPVQQLPYMPPQQFFHAPSYPPFQYPSIYYRPSYYGPVQMPVYKPLWGQQTAWGQFPNAPPMNPQQVPFGNYYYGQQRPPMLPAHEVPLKSYHQYQEDYYVKKPTQKPATYQAGPQPGLPAMPMLYSDYDHQKSPSFDPQSSVKGSDSGGVLQKLLMPNFPMPRWR